MPLDYDEYEKLHEDLNRLFDQRIKDRVEESVQRFLPMVDQMIKDRFNAVTYDPVMSTALESRIKRDAESAADHYIRLFGGSPAIHEIVERLWDKNTEKYIQGEVDRRLREILKKLNAIVPEQK